MEIEETQVIILSGKATQEKAWGKSPFHFREIPLPNREKQLGISVFCSNFATRNQR